VYVCVGGCVGVRRVGGGGKKACMCVFTHVLVLAGMAVCVFLHMLTYERTHVCARVCVCVCVPVVWLSRHVPQYYDCVTKCYQKCVFACCLALNTFAACAILFCCNNLALSSKASAACHPCRCPVLSS
jgi:hypothetical protein